MYLLLASCTGVHACWQKILMPQEAFIDFYDTKKDIKNRLAIVQKYVNATNINKVIYHDKYNIVTDYFDNIELADIHKDNAIITYFFSQGLNFTGQRSCFSERPSCPLILNHILSHKLVDQNIQVEEKIQRFDNALLLTRICLHQKIKHSQIPKTIAFFYKILKAFNNKKDCLIKIPKPVFNIIISKYLLDYDPSVQDIVDSLDQTKKRLTINHNDTIKNDLLKICKNNHCFAFSFITVSLYEWTVYHARDLGNYERNKDTLALLNPVEWHNNSLVFCRRLHDEFNK